MKKIFKSKIYKFIHQNKKILFWVYVLVVLLLIILPLNGVKKLNDITIISIRGDYFFHAVLLLPWMLLFPTGKLKIVIWFLIGLLFAIGIEFVQYFLSYRSFNINDVIANTLGVIAGLFVALGWQKFVNKNV